MPVPTKRDGGCCAMACSWTWATEIQLFVWEHKRKQDTFSSSSDHNNLTKNIKLLHERSNRDISTGNIYTNSLTLCLTILFSFLVFSIFSPESLWFVNVYKLATIVSTLIEWTGENIDGIIYMQRSWKTFCGGISIYWLFCTGSSSKCQFTLLSFMAVDKKQPQLILIESLLIEFMFTHQFAARSRMCMWNICGY